MFTGLIQNLGEIKGRVQNTIEVSGCLPPDIGVGDSIAVNGICLTATKIKKGSFLAELSPETLAKTTANEFIPNFPVNLEFPLSASSPLGGHIVQGHIDGVGKILKIEKYDDSHRLEIEFPPALSPCIVPKGSICVDGVSLTVNSLSHSSFSVMIIPHTWNLTVIHKYQVGNHVNLEVDILAKYVQRAFQAFSGTLNFEKGSANA